MKIYFEDGPLRTFPDIPRFKDVPYRSIDARLGFRENTEAFETFEKMFPDDAIVYTNSLAAFVNGRGWNETRGAYDIFMRGTDGHEWLYIQSFTDRELRKSDLILFTYVLGRLERSDIYERRNDDRRLRDILHEM